MAQLDRASDYGSEGCGFESYWARHITSDMIDVSHKSIYKRYVEYPITGFFARLVFAFFSITPFRFNSALGGFLFRTLGPLLNEHKTAKNNLKIAFPQISEPEADAILTKMWNNIGRTFFEFPKLDYIAAHGHEFVTINHPELAEKIKNDKNPVFFVSAHYGNWEVMRYFLLSVLKDHPCCFMYRPPNNPYLADIFSGRGNVNHKDATDTFPAIEKGLPGFKKLVTFVKKGYSVFSLVDQKLFEGVEITFFGRKVHAVPAPASLAIKYKRDVYMILMKRTGDTTFEIDLEKLPPPQITGNDHEENIRQYTQVLNDCIEREIRKNPEQWFWVHNRFK